MNEPKDPEATETDLTESIEAVCPFADAVSKRIEMRAQKGLEKYGVTCERSDLDLHQWLTHLQEELMDAAVYIERTKYEIWREKEDSKSCDKETPADPGFDWPPPNALTAAANHEWAHDHFEPNTLLPSRPR